MVVKKHKERKGKEKKPREGRKKEREEIENMRVHGDISKSKRELVGEGSSKKRACEV